MIKPLMLAAFCAASLIGCVNAVGLDNPSVTTQNTQPSTSSLRVVGDTLYFLNGAPDKLKPIDFKDQSEIESHYATLVTALKKRNPVQDARFAFNNGMRYFLTATGKIPAQRQRGNPLALDTPESAKSCPRAFAQLKFLEGVKFTNNPRSSVDSVDCVNGHNSCTDFMEPVADYYKRDWNNEMSRLCLDGKTRF